jgi:RimJ/RimL family protein N-acetyltransferase
MRQRSINRIDILTFPCMNINDEFILRELSLDDDKDFFAYCQDERVCRHVIGGLPKSLPDAREELAYCQSLFYRQKGCFWAMAKKNTNQLIGQIGCYIDTEHDASQAEICYELAHGYWGLGLASMSMTLVLDYVFKKLHLNQIYAKTTCDNHRSIALLNKFQFKIQQAKPAQDGNTIIYRCYSVTPSSN